ncbi:MAG: hypothetical protein ABSD21_03590 [Rhizomicrobium sp.]
MIEAELPEELDDHQASIFLKTDLLSYVKGSAERFCYLDSDVIAAGEGVDAIFDYRAGAVTFAPDHADVDAFSRWAVQCGCRDLCPHLREALARTFGIDIARPDWRLWNGGVFLFDGESEEFLAAWHGMSCEVMDDPYWRTRDQGTLAGAAWKFGLQDQPVLPQRFNFIVDCMRGVSPQARPALKPEQSFVRTDYVLGAPGAPQLLHFINGGVGRRGWSNWDDAEALLAVS